MVAAKRAAVAREPSLRIYKKSDFILRGYSFLNSVSTAHAVIHVW